MACLVASPRGKGNLRHGDVVAVLLTIGALQFLTQGTLHPDVIETVFLTGGRPGRLHPVRPRQTRSSRFSTPVVRGIAAIAGSRSFRSLTKAR
jgi:hypothetical protein